MRILAVIIFGIILSSNIVLAVEQELLIPLPGLIGLYEMTRFELPDKVSVFQVPGEVSHVLTAKFRLVGNASLGTAYCPTDDVFESLVIEMAAGLHDTASGIHWYTEAFFRENGVSVGPSGLFMASGAAEGDTPTLDFLLVGTEEIQVHAIGLMNFPECGWFDSNQTVDVTEAYLVLTVDIPTPVVENSWSSLKALYR